MPMPQQLAFSVPAPGCCRPACLPARPNLPITGLPPLGVCGRGTVSLAWQRVCRGQAAAAQLTTSLSQSQELCSRALCSALVRFVLRSLRFLSRGNKAAFCFKQPGGGSFECLDETTNISTYLQVSIQVLRYFCQVNSQYSSSTFQYFYTTLEWFSIHK